MNPNLINLFLLAEEQNNSKRDAFGRFLFKDSKIRDISKAYVSREFLKTGQLKPVQWPDGKNFAICLTHDIDKISPGKRERIKIFLESIKNRSIKLKNFYWNFDQIIQIEKSYKANSTFFLMASKGPDKRYDIATLKKVIHSLEKDNFEIGLHGDFFSTTQIKYMSEEKKALSKFLNETLYGIRQHFLKIEIPLTFENQIISDFKYDSTLGYPDQIGFKNGMAHPFYIKIKKLDKQILEIPLAIMDATFQTNKNNYLTDQKKIWTEIKDILDEVIAVNGCVSILWHNDRFSEDLYPGGAKMYENILAYCSEKNAWLTSCKNVFEHIHKTKPTLPTIDF